jgi:N-acetylmuramoyl-L-alanine amidase
MFPITEKFISGHNRPYRKLNALKAIIIHWTANLNRGANATANRNYFNSKHLDANGNVIYASAHYIVDSTSIVQCLPDNEVGYHVGAKASRYTETAHRIMGTLGSPNYVTIGIEMCVNSDGNFDITRAQTIELTRVLAKKYSISRENVLRHYDITRKDCPRMMIDETIWNTFLDEIFTEAAALNQYRVNVSQLNVRSGDGTNNPIVRKLASGDIVTVTNRLGVWYQIGVDEFVHSDYLVKV